MLNNNYTASGGRNWSETDFYEAADVGAFNARAGHDSFAAYCTFILRGGVQDIAANMVEQILWGNLNDSNSRGWEIALIAGSGNELFLAARAGIGTDVSNALFTLANSAPGTPATPIERLIMAGLWYDGTTLFLSVNGVLASYVTSVPPLTSSMPARIGAGHETPPVDPALNVDIVSVGYFNEVDFNGGAGSIGEFAADAFSAARENGGNSAYMRPSIALDWTHRYDFVDSTGATITKRPGGAAITTLGLAPATLTDLGGQGLQNPNLATNTPVPLTRNGNVHGFTRRNADWFVGGTFITAGAG